MGELHSGGGWQAIWYALRKAGEAGGLWKLYRALSTRNTCKTCAVGMGGQRGGMVNERGSWPEVCKKSIQAMTADMQPGIADDFWSRHPVAHLRAMSPRQLEHCGRLTRPVIHRRGSDRYEPIGWDAALEELTGRLKQTDPTRTFWYFSGRSSNEAGFLLQVFARLYGTNHVNNCSYFCHQASGVGLQTAIGTATATVTLEDLEQADCVFLIGGNPASNHPRLMTTLVHLRRRGGQVVVINPVVELGLVNFRVPSDVRSLLFGSAIASLYLQPHIGGDLALLAGLAKRLDELGAVDTRFVTEHCCGWENLRASLRDISWEHIERESGIEFPQIDDAARRYAAAKSVIFAWTMGITHHTHGVQNVQAIANLALLRGMVGRPGAGLLPIRGHSNVQGIGSVGVTPQLKDAVLARLRDHYGIQPPPQPGLDTLSCLEAAARGEMELGVCVGGNLYGACPDAAFAARAFAALEQVVYLSTTLNTGHAHGLGKQTLILPVLARDEEPQPTTQESMFNLVRYSDGGPPRHAGPRSEVEVLAQIARGVLGDDGPIDWRRMQIHRNIRQAIGRVVPGFEELSAIDDTRREFTIGGRIFHQPNFATPDGRARLHAHALPHWDHQPGRLRLMTVRSEGQFNTVVYEEEDLYRGQERRDVILLHPEDMRGLGLRPDQRVTVRSEAGVMPGILVRPFERIKPGNALMYYPEANILVPRQVDPASRTPAYKHVVVTVEASQPQTVARPEPVTTRP